MAEKRGDGVNCEGLDFRAGWVEALAAFSQRIQIEGMRGSKRENAGMDKALGIARDMYNVMIAKIKGEGK